MDVGALFAEHYLVVFRTLCRWTRGDGERAEDLAMRTFERAIRAAPRYEDRGQPRSWLYRIARNLLTDDLRRSRPTVRLDSVPNLATAEAGSERQVNRLVLHDAIGRLCDRQRLVIERRFLEGWSVRETAESLGLTDDAAKKLQARALANLGAMLEAA